MQTPAAGQAPCVLYPVPSAATVSSVAPADALAAGVTIANRWGAYEGCRQPQPQPQPQPLQVRRTQEPPASAQAQPQCMQTLSVTVGQGQLPGAQMQVSVTVTQAKPPAAQTQFSLTVAPVPLADAHTARFADTRPDAVQASVTAALAPACSTVSGASDAMPPVLTEASENDLLMEGVVAEDFLDELVQELTQTKGTETALAAGDSSAFAGPSGGYYTDSKW